MIIMLVMAVKKYVAMLANVLFLLEMGGHAILQEVLLPHPQVEILIIVREESGILQIRENPPHA
jgi:hypothetical protein